MYCRKLLPVKISLTSEPNPVGSVWYQFPPRKPGSYLMYPGFFVLVILDNTVMSNFAFPSVFDHNDLATANILLHQIFVVGYHSPVEDLGKILKKTQLLVYRREIWGKKCPLKLNQKIGWELVHSWNVDLSWVRIPLSPPSMGSFDYSRGLFGLVGPS